MRRATRRMRRLLAIIATVASLALPGLVGAPLLAGCADRGGPGTEADEHQVQAVVRQGLTHDDPYVRTETAWLLRWGPASLRAELERAVDDDDPLVALIASGSLLHHAPSHEQATARLQHAVAEGTPVTQIAALEVARQHMPAQPHAQLLELALAPERPAEVRRRAMADLVELLKGGTLPPARARALEQRLSAFATDSDVEVATLALTYITSVARLAGEAQTRRAILHQLLKTGDAAAQERALQLLTGARDPDLASLAYDPFLRAESDPQLSRLREVAAIALGSTGDTFRVAELEAIARRDSARDLQLGALGALARIDSPEARKVLINALQNPAPEVRRHVLRAMLAQRVDAQAPEDILRATDAETRVLGLKVLWQQGPERFRRVVAQKLEVESFRAPLLQALAQWADETPLTAAASAVVGLPWLSPLMPTLEQLSERVADEDPLVQAALYSLLGRSMGPAKQLERWDTLPLGGRYALLRQMLELRADHPAFRKALDSPFFVVELLGAIGVSR